MKASDGDIRFDEGGTFTDHGYIVNNQDRFIEQYNGDREEIPDEYRVFTSADEQELDEPADLNNTGTTGGTGKALYP